MRKILTVFLFISIAVEVAAQGLTVTDFHADPSDISAVRYEVKDYNGVPCALLKIGLVLKDVSFEGPILQSNYKDGEWWVYMADGAWWLTVKSDKYLPLRYEFPESLQKKSTYIMQIQVPHSVQKGPTGKMRFESNVVDADVYVDGEKLSSILPFEYEGEEGEHVVEVQAAGYNPAKMTFNINLKRKGTTKIQLAVEGSIAVDGYSYEMQRIPGRTFQMGSSAKTSNESTFSYEEPVHLVTLRTYKIGKTEVSQGLWKVIMGSNPSLHQGDSFPVENVSWYEVQEFINLLNERTGRHFRLPTEAEWEFAARSGGATGPDEPAGGLNSKGVVTGSATTFIGSKDATSYGLYDMSGNVAEWCSDWIARYSSSNEQNPTGAEEGIQKVVRGGSFQDTAWFLRTAYRGHKKPGDSDGMTGFRLAEDDY